MAEPTVATPHPPRAPVDRELFSLHPEEHVTERPSHRLQATYTEFALRRLLPGWYVAANMGVYWVPGEFEYPWAGPDVFVARNQPVREDASVYLTYEDGPLTLVVEIASPSTRKMDRNQRDTVYALELEGRGISGSTGRGTRWSCTGWWRSDMSWCPRTSRGRSGARNWRSALPGRRIEIWCGC
jgi:hypothetical protein